jgi:hypothetical protein
MCDFIFSFQDFLKLVPGLILLPFSIYFAYLKLRYKFSVSYVISNQNTNPEFISSITINNHKDKNVNIFAIYAMSNNAIYYKIIEFKKPLTIKSLESVQVDIPAYYSLSIDGESFKPDFLSSYFEIYISTYDSLVRCEIKSGKTPNEDILFKNLKNASIHTKVFNGINYGPSAKFAIIYVYKNTDHTAIIDNGGMISYDWPFHFNAIPKTILNDPEKINAALIQNTIQYNIAALSLEILN